MNLHLITIITCFLIVLSYKDVMIDIFYTNMQEIAGQKTREYSNKDYVKDFNCKTYSYSSNDISISTCNDTLYVGMIGSINNEIGHYKYSDIELINKQDMMNEHGKTLSTSLQVISKKDKSKVIVSKEDSKKITKFLSKKNIDIEVLGLVEINVEIVEKKEKIESDF